MPNLNPQRRMSPVQRVRGMQVTDRPDMALLDPEEAQRQLRMANARRSYMMRFGMGPMVDGQRAASTPSPADIEALLRRVQTARQLGWKPGRA